MGYRTYYNIAIEDVENQTAIIEELRNECEDANYAFDENGDPQTDCTWYEHEEHLKDFSLKHPDLLFTLNGEGEESGDMWYKYFKNGKMQACHAQIIYDEYDESKLS